MTFGYDTPSPVFCSRRACFLLLQGWMQETQAKLY